MNNFNSAVKYPKGCYDFAQEKGRDGLGIIMYMVM